MTAPITNDEVWDEAAATVAPLVTDADTRRKDTVADFLAGRSTYGDNHVVPPPPAATGATAGTPGAFTPQGAATPANLAALATVTADPATAWTAGQSVVLGDASHAFWNGTAWAAGTAT